MAHAPDPRWRTRFGAYLTERIGQELLVGELVAAFAELVPLHHASRLWLAAQGNPASLSMPMMLRRHAVVRQLRIYPLQWTPAIGGRRRITDLHVVRPTGTPCRLCGTLFLGQYPGGTYCGRSCARKASVTKAHDARGRFAAEPVRP